jgi:hypothetical protein
MKKSSFLMLNWADIGKGLIITVLGAVVGLITATIEAGSLDFDWAVIGRTALLAALTYLTKNLFTNSNDKFLKAEPK